MEYLSGVPPSLLSEYPDFYQQDPGQQFHILLETAYARQVRLCPGDAADVGAREYDARLPDSVGQGYPYPLNEELREGLFVSYTELLSHLTCVQVDRLAPTDRRSYERFLGNLALRLNTLRGNTDYNRPIDHTPWSMPQRFVQDIQGTGRYPIESELDLVASAMRTRQWLGWVRDEAIPHMERGAQIGDTQPAIILEMALARQTALLSGDTLERLYMQPFQAVRERTGVSRAAADMYSKVMRRFAYEGYELLSSHLRQSLENSTCRSDEHPGLCYVPDGLEQYRRLMYFWAGERRDVRTVHEEGKEGFWRAAADLEKLARRLGHSGDLHQFMHFMYNDPSQMPYRTQDDIVRRLQRDREFIQRNLHRFLAGGPASTHYDVHIVAGKNTAAPIYVAPSTDHRRPGGVYVFVEDPATYLQTRLVAASLHEALGHHIQLEWQRELHMPPFLQAFAPCFAFREAWAMYAEAHAEEMGFPLTDYDRAFSKMVRLNCYRGLVLDTGIHGLGWSVERARQERRAMFGSEGRAEEQEDIARFIAWPAQVQAYLQEEELQRLRNETERSRGTALSAPAFHSLLIRHGEMELDILGHTVRAKH